MGEPQPAANNWGLNSAGWALQRYLWSGYVFMGCVYLICIYIFVGVYIHVFRGCICVCIYGMFVYLRYGSRSAPSPSAAAAPASQLLPAWFGATCPLYGPVPSLLPPGSRSPRAIAASRGSALRTPPTSQLSAATQPQLLAAVMEASSCVAGQLSPSPLGTAFGLQRRSMGVPGCVKLLSTGKLILLVVPREAVPGLDGWAPQWGSIPSFGAGRRTLHGCSFNTPALSTCPVSPKGGGTNPTLPR